MAASSPAHQHHHDHGHDGHHHRHEPSFNAVSGLTMSLGGRLGVAAGLGLLLWGAMFWAMR